MHRYFSWTSLQHCAACPISWEYFWCAHFQNRTDFRCSRWVLNYVKWHVDCVHWVCCFVHLLIRWHPHRCDDALPVGIDIAVLSMGFHTNQSLNILHSFHRSVNRLPMTEWKKKKKHFRKEAKICELRESNYGLTERKFVIRLHLNNLHRLGRKCAVREHHVQMFCDSN